MWTHNLKLGGGIRDTSLRQHASKIVARNDIPRYLAEYSTTDSKRHFLPRDRPLNRLCQAQSLPNILLVLIVSTIYLYAANTMGFIASPLA